MLQLANEVYAVLNDPAQLDFKQEVLERLLGIVGAETLACCTTLTLYKRPK